jgi:hypothetical protein
MRGGATSAPFVAVLVGASMVWCQAIVWTLERTGPLSLFAIGAVAIIVFAIGLLPSFPPSPPPWWRSEAAIAVLTGGLALIVFLVAGRHIGHLRCGGGPTALQLKPIIASVATSLPRTRERFPSPVAAQFWFEWRCSGFPLPVLVAGVLLFVIAPLSWLARDDAVASFRILLGTFTTPLVLAIPIGMAFARPSFWSDDLSIPAFVAVRPLTDEDLVAVKMKVAAASVAISWLLVLCFLGVWLSLWANVDVVSQLAIQWWAFHERSIISVYGVVALMVIAGVILTWRFLVIRLWSGLSGSRPLFMISVMSVLLVVSAALVFDADRLPVWVLGDPTRMAGIVWLMSIAGVAKCWLAAYSWRRLSGRRLRQYFLVWGAGTACVLALAMLLWGVVRIYVALDIYRFQSVMLLGALLAVPLARVGLAPSSLTRNRHR